MFRGERGANACTIRPRRRAISSVCSARGVDCATFSPHADSSSRDVIGAPHGATGAAPPGWKVVCDARPTCHSWQKKTAPLALTAAVMGRHAAAWSAVNMPGVFGSPKPGKDGIGTKEVV